MAKINWTAGDGRNVEVSVELITTETVNADGHQIDVTLRNPKLSVVASINGVASGYGEPVAMSGHPVAVSRIGQVGMSKDNHDRVTAAINDAKESDVWIAYQERVAANRAALDKDEESFRQIERAMNR